VTSMRRNVLATELVFLLVLAWVTGISVAALGLLLNCSSNAIGVIAIPIGLIVLFFSRSLQSWLAPRIGICPPRPLGHQRKA